MSEIDYSKFKVSDSRRGFWVITDGQWLINKEGYGELIHSSKTQWGYEADAIEFLGNLQNKIASTLQPTNKYKTKPIDYTGCDPVVAEHLKRGESIECDINHSSGKPKYVIGYDISTGVKYQGQDDGFVNATPIIQTQYVKKASEIVKWLEDNDCEYIESSGKWRNVERDIYFSCRMFKQCGQKPFAGWEWLEEWLEWR